MKANWMLWLAARLVLDGAAEVAEASIRAALTHSTLNEDQREELSTELDNPKRTLISAMVAAIAPLREFLSPLIARTGMQRISPEQAESLRNSIQMEAHFPEKDIFELHSILLKQLRMAGEYGENQALAIESLPLLPETLGTADSQERCAEQQEGLAREWVGPQASERLWFGWPDPADQDGIDKFLKKHKEFSPKNACTTPDPAACRALRRLVLSLWVNQKESASLQQKDRYPHPVLAVVTLNLMEPWRTDHPVQTSDGLIMKSSGGTQVGSFPGLDPKVAERLVDNPGMLSGLTVRRLLRTFPRMAWMQAMEGVNPYNRLIFHGLQDLASELGLKDKTAIKSLPDILRAGEEWRKGNTELPPLWQLWMPEVLPRGKHTAEIRIDVGEGLCPGYVAPEGLHSRNRWILPVLDLPVLLAVDSSRRAALETLQWALLFELRVSAAHGDIEEDAIVLTEGQRYRAADRATVSRRELAQALEGTDKAPPWLAPMAIPGAWLLDCGNEMVKLSEPGAQQVLLLAAERASVNRKRHSRKI